MAGLTASVALPPAATAAAQDKAPVAIGALPQTGVHLVAPRDDKVVQELTKVGKISKDTGSTEIQSLVNDYHQSFAKKSSTWVNPQIEAAAAEHEKDTSGEMGSTSVDTSGDPSVTKVSVEIFALAVDFGGTDPLTNVSVQTGEDEDGNPICENQNVVTSGPMQGEIPQPGARDNNTVWYTNDQTANASFYEKLIFGYDGVGRVRMDLTDPVDGNPGINLAGYTVQDYYDKVSGGVGNVTLDGSVNGWVTVDHSEGYYGAPNCENYSDDGGAGVAVPQLIVDAVAKFKAANPTFDWAQYDQNHDGVLDTFWVIHAGMGEEAGGGAEGAFAIWSHSSDMRYYNAWYPNGLQVAGEDTPADTSDDIYVGPYTMQPENLDLGVLAEEFGHNVFGLPDMYSNDGQNSIGFWNIMSAGSWGGYLGGSVPVGMPLWFRMNAWCGVDWCNWQYPMLTRNYNDMPEGVTIGQLEDTPVGANKGVRINLPNVEETIPNQAGEGKAAWSGAGRDMTDATLDTSLSIPSGAAGVLSFNAYWDIEEDWDYGYVMVKDGSADWVFLSDMDGIFTDTNPNGNNLGVGLTGTADAATPLRFDLSAYAGKTVTLRLRYKTDAAATQNGWWVDDVKLDGAALDDFSGASGDGTFPNWTNSDPGWLVVPVSKSYVNYYLVEWRGATKYDQMVRTAYSTVYSDDDEWQVERVPYNIPGALVYYRNQKYPDSYAQRQWYGDPPSYGPKNKLLIVDMNPGPMRLGDTIDYLNSRVSSYDAALTLQGTQAVTLSSVFGLDGGPWSFAAEPAVNEFRDSRGYYAGFYFGAPCDPGYVCVANYDGSAVIPARGNYSTRITDGVGNPLPDFYGIDLGGGILLGSGNPADDGVQYGVNFMLTSQSGDTGTLYFYPVITDTKVDTQLSLGKFDITYTTTLFNSSAEDIKEPIPLNYLVDSQLTVSSINASSVDKGPSLGQFTWTLPGLKAGETTTLTLKASMPIDNGDNIPLLTILIPSNIWTAPVPWEFDTTASANYYFMPVVGSLFSR